MPGRKYHMNELFQYDVFSSTVSCRASRRHVALHRKISHRARPHQRLALGCDGFVRRIRQCHRADAEGACRPAARCDQSRLSTRRSDWQSEPAACPTTPGSSSRCSAWKRRRSMRPSGPSGRVYASKSSAFPRRKNSSGRKGGSWRTQRTSMLGTIWRAASPAVRIHRRMSPWRRPGHFSEQPADRTVFPRRIWWGAAVAGQIEVAVGADDRHDDRDLLTAIILMSDRSSSLKQGLFGFNGILVGAAVPTFLGNNWTMWLCSSSAPQSRLSLCSRFPTS